MSHKDNPVPITPVKHSPAIVSPYRGKPTKSYFALRSRSEIDAIKDIITYIKKGLSDIEDQKLATVYAIQARNTDMTKVGFTDDDEVTRVEDLMDSCGIQFQRMYQHPGFRGAHKAEQIIHKLLKSFNFELYNCVCRKVKVHKEWFSKPFLEIVATVQLVCNWIQYQEPFHSSGKLRDEWLESLEHWYATQTTTSPLEWTEFFLRHTRYWRDYPIHIPVGERQRGGLIYTPKKLESEELSMVKHRPTGYFHFSPVETYEHTEVYHQELKIESMQKPDGTKISKIKEEQSFHTQELRNIAHASSSARDENVFNAKNPNHQPPDGLEVEYNSEPIKQGSEEVQTYTYGVNDGYGQIFDPDEQAGDSSADDIPLSDYGSPVPKPRKSRKGNRDGDGNGKGRGHGGQGGDSGSRRNYRAPRPQYDGSGNGSGGEAALGNDGAEFIAPKLARRTTMTDDVKAGANMMFDKVKRAGRHLKELPSVKPKKK